MSAILLNVQICRVDLDLSNGHFFRDLPYVNTMIQVGLDAGRRGTLPKCLNRRHLAHPGINNSTGLLKVASHIAVCHLVEIPVNKTSESLIRQHNVHLSSFVANRFDCKREWILGHILDQRHDSFCRGTHR